MSALPKHFLAWKFSTSLSHQNQKIFHESRYKRGDHYFLLFFIVTGCNLALGGIGINAVVNERNLVSMGGEGDFPSHFSENCDEQKLSLYWNSCHVNLNCCMQMMYRLDLE